MADAHRSFHRNAEGLASAPTPSFPIWLMRRSRPPDRRSAIPAIAKAAEIIASRLKAAANRHAAAGSSGLMAGVRWSCPALSHPARAHCHPDRRRRRSLQDPGRRPEDDIDEAAAASTNGIGKATA
jgi:hypothetical protein